eukprot:369375-Rhodomonas_salina.1
MATRGVSLWTGHVPFLPATPLCHLAKCPTLCHLTYCPTRVYALYLVRSWCCHALPTRHPVLNQRMVLPGAFKLLFLLLLLFLFPLPLSSANHHHCGSLLALPRRAYALPPPLDACARERGGGGHGGSGRGGGARRRNASLSKEEKR